MSPAAGGAAPTQTAASSALAPPSIATPEPDRAAAAPPPPQQANRRDPPGQLEGSDPGNAAARKTAWNVPAPPPAAAGPGGIIGGDASWPALAESARAWPQSASSDSLKSLSDGSAPSASEDLIVSSPLPHPVAIPISTGSNPTSTSPPPNATAAASSQQNGSTNQPNPVRHGGGNGGNSGGGSGGRGAGNNSSGDGNNGSGGDGNWNNGSIGSGRGCNSGYGDTNSSNGSGSSNMNNSVHSGGTSGSGNDSSRRAPANNNWNGHGRGGGGSNNNGTGSGDGSNRNSGGSSNLWNNNARNGSGSSNGFGGRGGRNRRDHERGASFTPRNYPRLSPVPQQQQPGIYQPGPFHRPPPPPPPAHFMVPQPFVPYAPPFAYPGDVQAYPFYLTPVEQFQNMHLVRQPMQPLWVHQDQQNLQVDIRLQMEFYFSTNNLCHDTYLRRHMNDQGWVPIDLIAQFNRMRRFTDLVDTNYILDAIRGSEILEVQGNNVRRRNDWAEWLLH